MRSIRIFRTLLPPLILGTVALNASAQGISPSPATPLSEARELRRTGHPDQAIQVLQRILRQTPKDVDAQLELVWALIQTDHPDEAQHALDPILAKYPHNTDGHLAQALLWRKKGLTTQAETEYRAILAKSPQDASARVGLADIHLQRRETRKARELYEAVLATEPANYGALVGMGRISAREHKFDQAREYFDRAHKANPLQNPDAQMDLAWGLIQANRLDEAQRILDPIRVQYPARVDARLAQALMWRKKGMNAQAETEYQSILAKNPVEVSALVGLADIRLQRGETGEARQGYEAALAREPANYDALLGMGRVAARERKWKVAQDYYGRAQQAVPSSDEPRAALQGLMPEERWTLAAWYSFSHLTGDRPTWRDTAVDLLYQATPNTWVGGTVVNRHRFGQTDNLYSARVSHIPREDLEVHGEVTLTPSADFSATQAYSAGVDWRTSQRLSLLFDYKRLNYFFGNLDIYTPGATVWFDDRNYLTGRYAYGRAFGDASFHNYSLLLNLGLPADARLRLGFARGADPERAEGVPATILTTANLYTVYLDWPVSRHTRLFAGAEHEDRQNIYTRDAATVGFSTRF